jgi:hypothetical protein
LLVLGVAGALGITGCSHDGRTLAPAKPDQTASIVTTSTLDASATFQLATPFGETTPIQQQYTCKGEDISPPMSWVAVPTGTAELALVVTDSDADDSSTGSSRHGPDDRHRDPRGHAAAERCKR